MHHPLRNLAPARHILEKTIWDANTPLQSETWIPCFVRKMKKFVSKVLEPFTDLRHSISRPERPGEDADRNDDREVQRGANTQEGDCKRRVKPPVVSAI